jgi:predicted nucleic acid-binding protein
MPYSSMISSKGQATVPQEAAQTSSAYVERLRRSGGGSGNRLLGDFVIAAHGLQRADRLMTFDASR